MNTIKLTTAALLSLLFFSIYSQEITTDFPGDNIRIDTIINDSIRLQPDLRDTKQNWFYWYFGVKNAGGKTLTFQFTQKNVFSAKGPAVSTDKGITWSWMGPCDSSFRYTFGSDQEVRFSVAMPYTEKDFDDFISLFNGMDKFRLDTLCISEKGRAVERILINEGAPEIKYKVLITARHHACEMMASYVLEGMIETILTDKSLGWLRKNVAFMIIPFVDKDGVEDGDQGKARRPHDHNRDYSGESLYATTAALRKTVPEWTKGTTNIGIDLHCPYIIGNWNDVVYSVGKEDSSYAQQQRIYIDKINKIKKPAYANYTFGFLPFGQSWNTAASFTEGKSFGKWFGELPGTLLTTTFEFPYAEASGMIVSQDAYREVGKSMAVALQKYLKK